MHVSARGGTKLSAHPCGNNFSFFFLQSMPLNIMSSYELHAVYFNQFSTYSVKLQLTFYLHFIDGATALHL